MPKFLSTFSVHIFGLYQAAHYIMHPPINTAGVYSWITINYLLGKFDVSQHDLSNGKSLLSTLIHYYCILYFFAIQMVAHLSTLLVPLTWEVAQFKPLSKFQRRWCIYSHNFDSIDNIMFLRFRCLTCLHVGLWRLTLAAALKTDSTSIAFTSLPSSGLGPTKYSVSTWQSVKLNIKKKIITGEHLLRKLK